MPTFSWDAHKNEKLIRERAVSFEAIVWSVQSGGLLEILDHPNAQRYPGQRIFVVQAKDYVYLVPFEEKGEDIRLITIIPSRKAFRKHQKRGETNEG
jgi:uncharacterized DUF497 family protein